MEKIRWTQEIATGLREIDGQHKKFLKLCDDIVQLAAGSQSSVKIGEAMARLEKFAEEIKERIADWFVLHIKKNDTRMATYVIKK